MIRLDDNGLHMSGSAYDLMIDVLQLVKNIYRINGNRNPALAEVFREALVEALNDPECPCWSKDWELRLDETLTFIRFDKRRTDD